MEPYNAAGFPFLASYAESEGEVSEVEDSATAFDSEDSDFFDASRGRQKKPTPIKSASRKSKKPPAPPLQKATVLLLANIEKQEGNEEADETQRKIIARIMKCQERGTNETTPESEAQTALAMAAKLMEQYNISFSQVIQQASGPRTWERGESCVRIMRTRGKSMQVATEAWTWDLSMAMKILFDVECFSLVDDIRRHVDWTFCGIAQNTAMAAQAFEVVYNLVCEWARSKGGSRNNYCRGVAHGFVRNARDTKEKEKKDAVDAAKVDRLAREAKEHLDRQRLMSRLKDLPANTGDDVKPEEMSPVKHEVEEFEGSETLKETTKASDDGDAGSSDWLKTSADQSEEIEDNVYVVEKLLQDDVIDGVQCIEVKWYGYEETSWETRDELLVDVTVMVAAYERRKRRLTNSMREEDDHADSVCPDLDVGADGWSDDDDDSADDSDESASMNGRNGIEAAGNKNALTEYRREAHEIAQEMLKATKTKTVRIKYVSIRDRSAYEDGKRDARDIDIKRKRIEDGTSDKKEIKIAIKRQKKER